MGWNTKYPIGLLVAKRADELNIIRVELMKRLGYANTDKGLRRLDDFLATGQSTSHLLRTLPDVLGLATREVEAAAAATRKQIADAEEAEARARFQAHILVTTKGGVRMPFFVQAFAYGEKLLALPDNFDSMSSAQQVRQAARIVRQHYREHAGELGTWGTIIGYRLQRTYDHAVLLNTDGTIQEGFNREPEPPASELRIKGRRISVGVMVGE